MKEEDLVDSPTNEKYKKNAYSSPCHSNRRKSWSYQNAGKGKCLPLRPLCSTGLGIMSFKRRNVGLSYCVFS